MNGKFKDVKSFTPEEISNLLLNESKYHEFFANLKFRALELLLKGEKIDGFMLGRHRGKANWKTDDVLYNGVAMSVQDALIAEFGEENAYKISQNTITNIKKLGQQGETFVKQYTEKKVGQVALYQEGARSVDEVFEDELTDKEKNQALGLEY